MKPKAPSAVRIQAGKWKGRSLEVPSGARPTSGRARAALFDLLGQDRLEGARVLDLFAGSGAVGLEAVSRGAAQAVLVEEQGNAIAKTLDRLQARPEEARLLSLPAEAALALFARSGEKFDLVFADPPYRSRAGGSGFDLAAELLSENGVFVLQADAADAPSPPPRLKELSRRAYGRNVFHFFGIL